jgi:hypothetical protein
MVMKRFIPHQLVIAVVVAALGGLGACNKPSADDCRQAIRNMQVQLGTDTAARNSDIEAEVRLCKGGSTKESVACAIKASSVQELKACDFMAKSASKSPK